MDAVGATFWDVFDVVRCDDAAGQETRLKPDGSRTLLR